MKLSVCFSGYVELDLDHVIFVETATGNRVSEEVLHLYNHAQIIEQLEEQIWCVDLSEMIATGDVEWDDIYGYQIA